MENSICADSAQAENPDSIPSDDTPFLRTPKNNGQSAAAVAAPILRSLLAGDVPENIPLDKCGTWEPCITAVMDGSQAHGATGARRAFNVLLKDTPGLVDLVASGGLTPTKTSWSTAELFQTEFPEPRWAVPGLVPIGLSSLAGRPKLGKSWLALQLAVAVGTGGCFLGERVDAGGALFLALEDSPRRLKDRLQRQKAPQDTRIHFETVWPFFSDGGLEALQERLTVADFSLVIIDTLSRALGRGDQMDAAEMTVLLGQLQDLAMSQDLALVLIDHHRKSSGFSSDPIDDIMGATAKAAVLDAAFGLYREPGRHGSILKVIGREIEERELAILWDPMLCCWQNVGEAGEVREDTVKSEIMAAIRELKTLGDLATTTKIAGHTGQKKANVSRALADLLAAGKVCRGQKQGAQLPYEVSS